MSKASAKSPTDMSTATKLKSTLPFEIYNQITLNESGQNLEFFSLCDNCCKYATFATMPVFNYQLTLPATLNWY